MLCDKLRNGKAYVFVFQSVCRDANVILPWCSGRLEVICGPRCTSGLSKSQPSSHVYKESLVTRFRRVPHGTARLLRDGFSWNLKFAYFFRKSVEKIQFHWNQTRITGTLGEYQHTFFIIFRAVLRMRNVLEKSFREDQNWHFIFVNFFCRKSCHLWANVEKYCRAVLPQMTIRRMSIACRIPKAMDTQSEYVILIAFPLHQWLHERASALRYAFCLTLGLPYFTPIRINWDSTGKERWSKSGRR